MLLVGAVVLAVLGVVPSPWSYVLVLTAAVVEIAETGFWVWLSRRRRVQAGVETLIGSTAVVVSPCAPLGQVRVQGELWQARCAAGAAPGERVVVRDRDGLTLLVEAAE